MGTDATLGCLGVGWGLSCCVGAEGGRGRVGLRAGLRAFLLPLWSREKRKAFICVVCEQGAARSLCDSV